MERWHNLPSLCLRSWGHCGCSPALFFFPQLSWAKTSKKNKENFWLLGLSGCWDCGQRTVHLCGGSEVGASEKPEVETSAQSTELRPAGSKQKFNDEVQWKVLYKSQKYLIKDSQLEIINPFQQSVYMSIPTSFSKIHCQEETTYALISIRWHSDCVMWK